ncbi:IS256 family transposase [Salinicoccus roseus]|uniref:IS256 family transposase n=1 Tax=Salinicoccus roseus TaxID=45670 RepID=UPI0023B7B125|nr:IS256 family transposase [Salinicoccus roseus]
MTQLKFNLDMDELTEQILSSNLNAATKGLAVAIFNAYMEAERDAHVQAKTRERSEERQDMRNGYYERDYTLPVGRLRLRVPRTRSGAFSTGLFEKYQRMDQSLVLSLVESVVSGVSTRKVTKIVEALCGESVSKSFISDIMKRLDPEIEAFRTRPLHLKQYRYLYVDAMYIKVRENHRVVSKAVYIAQGINEGNFREVLGFMVSEEESEQAWTAFFQDLRHRGLTLPKLIISDAHAGLKAAIRKEFVGSAWQRCTFHFTTNITHAMPRKDSTEQRRLLKRIFNAETPQHAKSCKAEFEAFVADDPKYEKALDILDAGFEDDIQFMMEPQAHHVSLKTSNSLERINREIRRREKVIGIFPNIDSALRLIGSILLDCHEIMTATNRKFLKD